MTNYAYDENLPYVVEFDGKPIARFKGRADAGYWASEEDGTVIDTTPLRLPEGVGAVVKLDGSMPLVNVGANMWVMPMSSGYSKHDGYIPACHPLTFGKTILTDDDVRELIRLKGGKFELLEGVQ